MISFQKFVGKDWIIILIKMIGVRRMSKYWDRIAEIAQKQTEKGLAKYGKCLEDNVCMDVLERIKMIEEELVDALFYLEHLKEPFMEKKPKIKLTDSEKCFVNLLKEDYKYIARNGSGKLFLFENVPKKFNYSGSVFWEDDTDALCISDFFNDMFNFITAEDKEPTSIEYLKTLCERNDENAGND